MVSEFMDAIKIGDTIEILTKCRKLDLSSWPSPRAYDEREEWRPCKVVAIEDGLLGIDGDYWVSEASRGKVWRSTESVIAQSAQEGHATD